MLPPSSRGVYPPEINLAVFVGFVKSFLNISRRAPRATSGLSKFMSAYARKNEQEDFAESLALQNPSRVTRPADSTRVDEDLPATAISQRDF